MISESNYRRLADEAYNIEPSKAKSNMKEVVVKGSILTDRVTEQAFQVLKTEDNTANGMQVMAVSPVDKHGNVDTSQVIIAYAGTNSGDAKDLDTDLQSIGLGGTMIASGSDLGDGLTIGSSQFQTAMAFAKEVEKEAKAKNPHVTITTTGHSLGESLAMYVALKQGYHNVGFK